MPTHLVPLFMRMIYTAVFCLLWPPNTFFFSRECLVGLVLLENAFKSYFLECSRPIKTPSCWRLILKLESSVEALKVRDGPVLSLVLLPILQISLCVFMKKRELYLCVFLLSTQRVGSPLSNLEWSQIMEKTLRASFCTTLSSKFPSHCSMKGEIRE